MPARCTTSHLVALAVAAAVAAGCGSAPPPAERAVAPEATGAPAEAREEWVVTAASPVTSAEQWSAAEVWDEGLEGSTLRQQVHATIGGRSARVTLSNRAGTAPLVVAAASVAVAVEPAGASAAVATPRPLTFDGEPGVTVEPGVEVVSDVVDLDVPADHDLAVNLYVTGPTGRPNGARYSGQTSWRGAGDLVDVAAGDGFTEARTGLAYVAAVEVLAPEPEGAVVVFGDSKSDGGLAVEADTEERWPDALHARLVAEGRRGVAVANASFSGATLLPDGDPTSGVVRFDGDVLARAGVRTVIVALGTNDLLWRTTDQIVAALEELVARGHAAGVRVVGATVPPFAGPRAAGVCTATEPPAMGREGTRLEVNQRIRGTDGIEAIGFDAVADFDAVLRDPEETGRIACRYSIYGLSHPNAAGHAAMAAAVDLATLMP
ncbi:MAG TPA: GDSL-type esterase/lipase family protein [Iamia sp.]|nr:GDSL-type esterase/lipase family protein [Iamia sp.]